MSMETGKRRRGEEEAEAEGAAEAWAQSFAGLEEEAQFLYLKHLAAAPLSKMHLQYLLGEVGDDDEDEEEFGEEEEGEEASEEGEEEGASGEEDE
ncbi:MAG: hypothetical protein SGPRY_004719 [Prymnesium sp.]